MMEPVTLQFIAKASGGILHPLEAGCMTVSGLCTDSRRLQAGELFLALRGERFDGHDFLKDPTLKTAAAVLISEDRRADVPPGLPVVTVQDTRAALGRIAAAYRKGFSIPVFCVAGSNGKTTTKELLAALLETQIPTLRSQASFNNDIGVPLTILGASASDGYLVAEIGMNRPGEIAPLAAMAAPHVVIVTMAGLAHLGGMGSAEAIVEEKSSIVDGLGTMGIAIVNGDQPALVAAVERRAKPGVRVVTFGTGGSCQWRLAGRAAQGAGQRMQVREPDGTEWSADLGLPGDYNAMNALAAAACARMLGIPSDAVAAAFAATEPADMRMTRQPVGGVTVFNDAYNANPDAVLASLRAFAELAAGASRRVTVLGDMLELGERSAELHASVGRAAVAQAPALAVFVGEASAHGASAARAAAGPGTEVLHVPALDESGVAAIAARLLAGDHVLLKGSRGSRMERLVDALRMREPASAR